MAASSISPTKYIIEAAASSSYADIYGNKVAISLDPQIDSVDSVESSHKSQTYTEANDGTALKSLCSHPLMNRYDRAPSVQKSCTVINTFSCSPRQIRIHERDSCVLKITALERHPYTTQVFTPLTKPGANPHSKYLVIVAPDSFEPFAQPDIGRAEAFVFDRGQAVTYAPGTWHSPMVVLGPGRIDFVVIQNINGMAEEDCETWTLNGGGMDVVIRLDLLQAGDKSVMPHGADGS